MTAALLMYYAAEDLKQAEQKLEAAAMELLKHNDLGQVFSGSVCAIELTARGLAEQLEGLVNDIDRGFTGGPDVTTETVMPEDPRVQELAAKLRAITCADCSKDCLSCRCKEAPTAETSVTAVTEANYLVSPDGTTVQVDGKTYVKCAFCTTPARLCAPPRCADHKNRVTDA